MSGFDAWTSRLSNLLGIIGFNWKTDPLVGAIVGLALGYWAYLETLSLRELLVTFVLVTAAVMVIAVAGRWLLRLFRGRGEAPGVVSRPIAPSGKGGGHSEPILTARDNAKINYTFIDNRIYVMATQGDENKPLGVQVTTASVGVRDGKLTLFNAANVSSIAASSPGVLDILFSKPIDPKGIVTNVSSGSTQVSNVTPSSARVVYDTATTTAVDVTFKSTKPSA